MSGTPRVSIAVPTPAPTATRWANSDSPRLWTREESPFLAQDFVLLSVKTP